MDKMNLLVRKQVFPYDVSSSKVLEKIEFRPNSQRRFLTQHRVAGSVGTLLELFETMSQQCCKVVLR